MYWGFAQVCIGPWKGSIGLCKDVYLQIRRIALLKSVVVLVLDVSGGGRERKVGAVVTVEVLLMARTRARGHCGQMTVSSFTGSPVTYGLKAWVIGRSLQAPF